ncbi:hypothetical protein [Streptomyces sp. NPDC059009]|uniref:hypothetical protein n=1 Tax=Streptomyces sp. NPDC059009 TaxID=3346694 RepID=UPI0036A38EE1
MARNWNSKNLETTKPDAADVFMASVLVWLLALSKVPTWAIGAVPCVWLLLRCVRRPQG